jgi:hypothetical protein
VSSSFYTSPDLPPERRLTVAEAARAANLTVPQVWSRINTGKLWAHVIPPPPVNKKRGKKRGRRPSNFIDLKDLEALIKPAAEGQLGSHSEAGPEILPAPGGRRHGTR